MNNFKKRYYFYFLIIIVLTLGLSISLQSLLAAWTAPTATPPSSNVNEPINSGMDTQSKTGDFNFGADLGVGEDLTILGDLTMNGLKSCSGKLYTNSSGNIKCGTDASGSSGDNLGNHNATQDLDMNGYNIEAIGRISNQDGVYGDTYFADPGDSSVFNQLYVKEICLGDFRPGVYSSAVCMDEWPSGDGGGTADNLGNHSATQHLDLNGYNIKEVKGVFADEFYDTDDSQYYLNPAAGSYLNVLYVGKIYDKNNTSYYVDPASTSKFNSITLGGVTRSSWPSGDGGGTTYSAGDGLNLSGTSFTFDCSEVDGAGLTCSGEDLKINAETCSSGEYSYWDGSSWKCRTDVQGTAGTTYSAGNGLSLSGTTFNVDNYSYMIDSAGTSGQVWTSDGSGKGAWKNASTGGDNLGNHSATQDLDMNGKNIKDIGGAYLDNIVFNTAGSIYGGNGGSINGFTNISAKSKISAPQVVGTSSLCIGSTCRTSWPTGDNLGNHSATQDLDMNGYEINDVSEITLGSTKAWIQGGSSNIYQGNTAFPYKVSVGTLAIPFDPYNFEVYGDALIWGGDLHVGYGGGSASADMYISGKIYDLSSSAYYVNPAGTSNLKYLNVNGTSITSDESLKKNIETISGLDIVNQLRGVNFEWKEDDRKDIGVIAQEVEKVLPEAVFTDEETGLKSVAYANLVAPLIEAIKEQQIQIEELKMEINKLKINNLNP